MFSLIRNNYKTILLIFLCGILTYSILTKRFGKPSEEIPPNSLVDIDDSLEFEEESIYGHKSVKRELKYDKYLEEFQHYQHGSDENLDYIDNHINAGKEKLKLKESEQPDKNIFTADELSEYNGENDNGKGLYIAIMGSVYDVSKGAQHYGPGGSYNFFAGRDASTSFISGEFETITQDLDDVLTLEPREILSLHQWKDFYDKNYIYKGKVIGRFYNENGDETEYFARVNDQIQLAIEEKANEEKENDLFPTCNIKWSANVGTEVWCTTKSGGKERDWVGVPRKYFQTGDSTFRCVCVKEDKLHSPNIKEYDNCDPKSITCTYKID